LNSIGIGIGIGIEIGKEFRRCRMDKNELARILRAEGFRADAYDLEGEKRDECYCLEEFDGGWVVYYSERGLKAGRVEFASEGEACEFLLGLMRRDPTGREHY
jgi:hypothetical protein